MLVKALVACRVARRWFVRASFTMAVLGLSSCGGGGGGLAFSGSQRAPLPQLSQDTVPQGARISVDADDFFAVAANDSALYSAYPAQSGPLIEVRREVTQGPDAQGRFTLTESVPTQPSIEVAVERWQRRAEGLFQLNVTGDDAPTGFTALVDDLLVYPTPFYPVGSVRTLVRQGGLGADLDGDGVEESFRFEFRQEFVGFETGIRGGRVERRARFRNRVALIIQPSAVEVPVVTSELTEEAVFAAHTGMISSVRTATINGGNILDHHGPGSLVSGILNGRDIETAWNGGSTRHIAMRHHDVKFEPVTGFYYAGLSARDATAPATVARIDPSTGIVVYSAPLGGDVRSIAVSSDGTTLYAGVFQRSEIVRMSLPDMQVQQRIAMPDSTWAFGLAVSPADPGTFAYYTDHFGASQDNSGIRLVRNGVIQALAPGSLGVRAEDTTWPVAFSPDGASVFMFGLTNAGRGIIRIPVVADGLGTQVQVTTTTTLGRSLSWTSGRLLAGNSLFDFPSMALVGAAADTKLQGCVALQGSRRWACKADVVNMGLRVGVVDGDTYALVPDGYVPIGPLPAGSNTGGTVVRVTPGPMGQVAVMVGGEAFWYGDWLTLLDNGDLR
jgi:hypothetical protein